MDRIIRKAQDPLVKQVKKLTSKVTVMSKLMTKVDTNVSNMNKNNKSILDAVDKVKSMKCCLYLFLIFNSSEKSASRPVAAAARMY